MINRQFQGGQLLAEAAGQDDASSSFYGSRLCDLCQNDDGDGICKGKLLAARGQKHTDSSASEALAVCGELQTGSMLKIHRRMFRLLRLRIF